MFLHAVQSLIWNRAASYRISSMKSDQILVGDLVQTEGEPKYVVVTQEDIDDKKYTLEDVVIPMVGKKSKFPTNELGDYMKKKLPSEIGITIEMFQQIQLEIIHILYENWANMNMIFAEINCRITHIN